MPYLHCNSHHCLHLHPSFSLYFPKFRGEREREMSFLLIRRPSGYSKVDKEDPEEIIRRRAQFLINKVLERADSRGKPSYLRIRIRRLKVRFGRRLKKLKKSALSSISTVKIGVYKQVISQLRNCKSLFGRKETTFPNLPPLLSS